MEVISSRLQPKLDCIGVWCEDNGMLINPGKAKALFLTLNNRASTSVDPAPTFRGTKITQEGSLTYLGVVFDRQLNFSKHVTG